MKSASTRATLWKCKWKYNIFFSQWLFFAIELWVVDQHAMIANTILKAENNEADKANVESKQLFYYAYNDTERCAVA